MKIKMGMNTKFVPGGVMIDKIVVTKEAVFDYEEIVCKGYIFPPGFKREAEKILSGAANPERVEYFDKTSEKPLLLFFKKGYAFGPMQTWILKGICDKRDYRSDMEEKGIIDGWLRTGLE